MSESNSTLVVALKFAVACEAVQVPYFLGGSVASSLQGQPRHTQDIDFVVELTARQVPDLIRALGPDFEVDDEALIDAVQRNRSCTIFFLPEVMRLALFIAGDSEFDRLELARRQKTELLPGRFLFVKSPEDSVPKKVELVPGRWRTDEQSVERRGRDSPGAERPARCAVPQPLGSSVGHSTPAGPRSQRSGSLTFLESPHGSTYTEAHALEVAHRRRTGFTERGSLVLPCDA